MALKNFTEVEDYKSYGEKACAPEIREGIHNQLIRLSVITSFLSINAFLGNTLIFVALHKESSLHAPSKLLFRTLATTDLCFGIILELLVVTALISMMFSVFVYISCNKRGQTSRPVVRTSIQTSCKFKANICNSHCIWGSVDCRLSNVLFESPYHVMVY